MACRQQTILVVDDEPLIRAYLVEVLEEQGHIAREAANADEALTMLSNGSFTLLLTDIDMPGSMDGLELARTVYARWPSIAVVITSGRRLPRPNEMPGESQFLSKPFSEGRLKDVLGE
jgi:CheY-like chemotaxis protein